MAAVILNFGPPVVVTYPGSNKLEHIGTNWYQECVEPAKPAQCAPVGTET